MNAVFIHEFYWEAGGRHFHTESYIFYRVKWICQGHYLLYICQYLLVSMLNFRAHQRPHGHVQRPSLLIHDLPLPHAVGLYFFLWSYISLFFSFTLLAWSFLNFCWAIRIIRFFSTEESTYCIEIRFNYFDLILKSDGNLNINPTSESWKLLTSQIWSDDIVLENVAWNFANVPFLYCNYGNGKWMCNIGRAYMVQIKRKNK